MAKLSLLRSKQVDSNLKLVRWSYFTQDEYLDYQITMLSGLSE